MSSNDKVTEKEFTHQGTGMDGMPFVESSLLRQLKEATSHSSCMEGKASKEV